MRCTTRSLAIAAVLSSITALIAGCAQGPPRPALVQAAGTAVSRDCLGVANASDVEIEVWLATEGSVLDSAAPRWFIDGPWRLPAGSLWLHGQQAHEQTVSTAPGTPPPQRIGHGRAFACIRYADDPAAPKMWAEITRGGLGVKRPATSTDLVLILMPRSVDQPLELLPPLPAIGGLPADALPARPRQSAEVHQTLDGLNLPLRKPSIVLNPQAPAAPAPTVIPTRHAAGS